ncbi:MAG: hypothetical protein BWY66_02984 [bacterium ADurb.Bin374]|nr:MAG: hypothetical protein BWY66_02984 [bacterium ADurb.Bin374]
MLRHLVHDDDVSLRIGGDDAVTDAAQRHRQSFLFRGKRRFGQFAFGDVLRDLDDADDVIILIENGLTPFVPDSAVGGMDDDMLRFSGLDGLERWAVRARFHGITPEGIARATDHLAGLFIDGLRGRLVRPENVQVRVDQGDIGGDAVKDGFFLSFARSQRLLSLLSFGDVDETDQNLSYISMAIFCRKAIEHHPDDLGRICPANSHQPILDRLPRLQDLMHRVVFDRYRLPLFIHQFPWRIIRRHSFHLVAVHPQQFLCPPVDHENGNVRRMNDDPGFEAHQEIAIPLFAPSHRLFRQFAFGDIPENADHAQYAAAVQNRAFDGAHPGFLPAQEVFFFQLLGLAGLDDPDIILPIFRGELGRKHIFVGLPDHFIRSHSQVDGKLLVDQNIPKIQIFHENLLGDVLQEDPTPGLAFAQPFLLLPARCFRFFQFLNSSLQERNFVEQLLIRPECPLHGILLASLTLRESHYITLRDRFRPRRTVPPLYERVTLAQGIRRVST